MQKYLDGKADITELLKKAGSCMHDGRYAEVAEVAAQLELLNCSAWPLAIYHRLWELTGEKTFEENIRRLAIPLAEKLCAEGRHNDEGRLYESAGLMPESLLAYEEDRVYGNKNSPLA